MSAVKLGHFYGGQAVSAETPLESLNPSNTDEVVARYPSGGASEVDAAA